MKEDSRAVIKEWLAQQLVEAKQRLSTLDESTAGGERELRELEQLQADIAQFEGALDKALNWPKEKPVKWDHVYNEKTNRMRRVPKYGRRPTKWKGRHGYEFTSEILAIQARDNCSQADAIRTLKKDNPTKWPENQRRLERVFGEIRSVWEPWCRLNALLEARAEKLLAKTD